MGDTTVGLCYRPSDQEEVNEASRQLKEASFTGPCPHERLLPQQVVEEAMQQGTGNPRGFWNASRTDELMREGVLLDFTL